MPRAAPVIRTRRPERGGLVRIRHTLLSTNTSVRKSSTGAQGKQRLSGGELRSWWSSSDTRDDRPHGAVGRPEVRSEEHTSELQSLMRISYAVFCLTKKKIHKSTNVYLV